MSKISRPLISATTPLVGPIDIAGDGFAIISQQDDAVYILIAVTYQTGTNNVELLFTPYFSGSYTVGGSGADFVTGIDLNNGTYNAPVKITNILNVYGQTRYVTSADIALFNYSNGMLVTASDQTNIYSIAETVNGVDYVTSYVGDQTASSYNLTSSSAYFDFPNIYAGFPYSFTFNGVTPFRYLRAQQQTNGQNFLFTPAFCTSTTSKPHYYMCNNSNPVNPFNVLRYIALGDNNSGTIDYPAQTRSTFINFFTMNFFQSNATFANGILLQGAGVCVQTSSVQGFLEQVYYMWASGFQSYSNNTITGGTPIVSQGTPGFISFGSSFPTNITGWTNATDCGRKYFYSYCIPGTSANSCGTCFGPCVTGQACTANKDYQPPTPTGSNPFVCGSTPDPNPTPAESFWAKYKNQIIIGIIIVVVVILAIIIIIVLSNRSKKANVNDEVYEEQ